MPPNNGNQPTTDPELDRIDSDITKHRKYAKRLVITVFAIFFIYFSIAVLIDISLDKDNNWIKPEWAKIYTVDSGHWGTFGDFIGGILNPTFALLAFYWLTYSVRLQIKELRETKEELRKAATAQQSTADHQKEIADLDRDNVNTQKEILAAQKDSLTAQAEVAKGQQQQIALQNFESLFFELLKVKDAATDDIKIYGRVYLLQNEPANNLTFSGKDAVKRAVRYFKSSKVYGSWEAYYTKGLLDFFGSYFRVCYQIVKLINDNKFLKSTLPEDKDPEIFYSLEQKKYFDIFRATFT